MKKELKGFRDTKRLARPYLLISHNRSRLQPNQSAPHTGHVKVKQLVVPAWYLYNDQHTYTNLC